MWGTLEDCDVLILGGLEVAGHHFVILEVSGAYFLEDLDSETGTWVNGRKASGREALSWGDSIEAGQLAFTFEKSDSDGGSSRNEICFAPVRGKPLSEEKKALAVKMRREIKPTKGEIAERLAPAGEGQVNASLSGSHSDSCVEEGKPALPPPAPPEVVRSQDGNKTLEQPLANAPVAATALPSEEKHSQPPQQSTSGEVLENPDIKRALPNPPSRRVPLSEGARMNYWKLMKARSAEAEKASGPPETDSSAEDEESVSGIGAASAKHRKQSGRSQRLKAELEKRSNVLAGLLSNRLAVLALIPSLLLLGGVMLWKTGVSQAEDGDFVGAAPSGAPKSVAIDSLEVSQSERGDITESLLQHLSSQSKPRFVVRISMPALVSLLPVVTDVLGDQMPTVGEIESMVTHLTPLTLGEVDQVLIVGSGVNEVTLAITHQTEIPTERLEKKLEPFQTEKEVVAERAIYTHVRNERPYAMGMMGTQAFLAGTPRVVKPLLVSQRLHSKGTFLSAETVDALMDSSRAITFYADPSQLKLNGLSGVLSSHGVESNGRSLLDAVRELKNVIGSVSLISGFELEASTTFTNEFRSAACAEFLPIFLKQGLEILVDRYVIESNAEMVIRDLDRGIDSVVEGGKLSARWHFSEEAIVRLGHALKEMYSRGADSAAAFLRAQRAATRAVTLFKVAQDAGATFENTSSVEDALTMLRIGMRGDGDDMKSRQYRLTDPYSKAMLAFLAFESGNLVLKEIELPESYIPVSEPDLLTESPDSSEPAFEDEVVFIPDDSE